MEDMIKQSILNVLLKKIDKIDLMEDQKQEYRDLVRDHVEKYGSKSMFHRGELDEKIKELREKWKTQT